MGEGEKDSPCVENRVEGKKLGKTRGGQEGRRRGGSEKPPPPLPPSLPTCLGGGRTHVANVLR